MEIGTFPKNIGPKLKVPLRLEFELAYDDITVQYVKHRSTLTYIDGGFCFEINKQLTSIDNFINSLRSF